MRSRSPRRTWNGKGGLRVKNPLNKRMLRELRSEMGKYAVIAILLIATIGFVSGFLVAGSSMIAAYNEGFEKYNIEDGHFRVEKQLNRAQLKAITGAGVTLYDLHYRETAMGNGSTLRIYPDRTQVNTISFTTPQLTEESRLAAPTPMIAVVLVWVVLTGIPDTEDTNRQAAAPRSAEKP